MKNDQLFQELEKVYRTSTELRKLLSETTDKLTVAHNKNEAQEKELGDLEIRLVAVTKERHELHDRCDKLLTERDALESRVMEAGDAIARERQALDELHEEKRAIQANSLAKERSAKSELEAANHKIKTLEQASVATTRELDSVIDTVHALQARLEAMSKEKAEIKEERNEARAAAATAQSSLDAERGCNEELRAQLTAANANIRSLTDKYNEVVKSRDGLAKDLAGLRDAATKEQDAATARISELERRVEDQRETIMEARAEMSRFADSSSARVMDLEEDLAAAQSNCETLEDEVSGLKATVRKAESVRDATIGDMRELYETCVQLQSQLATVTATAEEKDARGQMLLAQLVDVESTVLDLEKDKCRLRSELEGLQMDHERALSDAASRVSATAASLEVRNREYEDTVANLEARLASALSELADKDRSLAQASHSHAHERDNLRNLLDGTNDELNRALKMMEDDQAALKDKYEAKLANVNKLLDAEKAKTAKLTADLRDAKDNQRSAEVELGVYKDECQTLRAAVEDTKTLLDSATASVSASSAKTSSLESELSAMADAKKEVERDLDAANRRNESVLADKARTETALREARIRVNELTSELQALKDDASSAARESSAEFRDIQDELARSLQLKENKHSEVVTLLERDIQHLQREVERERAARAEVEAQLQDLELTVKERDMLQVEWQEAKNEVASLTEQLAAQEQAAQQQTAFLESAMNTLNEVTAANENLTARLRDLQGDRDASERYTREISLKLGRVEAASEADRRAADDAKEEVAKLHKQLEDCEGNAAKTVAEVESSLREVESENARLREELNSVSKLCGDLKVLLQVQ